jgi:hypothetical protein
MKDNEIKVEYFITFKESGTFCTDIETFRNFIRANKNFKISENKLTFKDLDIKFTVIDGEVESQKYFMLTLLLLDKSKIEKFEEALKEFKGLIYSIKGIINILWNDISFYYSQQAYPLIYEIENLMRKFITKFMLRKIGVDWVTKNLPKEVKEKLKEKKQYDVLFETDFIQLTELLFKTYPSENIERLFDILRKSKETTDLNIVELKEFIPKSNWERFFRPYIEKDIEEGFISKRWAKLYDLRCKVAHNNTFNKSDLIDLKKNIEDLKGPITKAIADVDFLDSTNDKKELLYISLMKELMDTSFGTDQDEIQGSKGQFGKNVDNPIPVNTIRGNIRYLEKIRTIQGEKILYEREGSTLGEVVEKPIDVYRIMDLRKDVIDKFYISPYHKKDSQKAPEGYLIYEEKVGQKQ